MNIVLLLKNDRGEVISDSTFGPFRQHEADGVFNKLNDALVNEERDFLDQRQEVERRKGDK